MASLYPDNSQSSTTPVARLPVILLLGAAGRLGRYCRYFYAQIGQLVIAPAGLGHDTNALLQLIDHCRPDLIINTIAWTAVDLAEQQPEQAARLNTELPARLAAACVKHHCRLIHFSTDYVFGNRVESDSVRPWRESDQPLPQQVYGQTKLDGERNIIDSGCRYAIFRIGWLYDEHDPVLDSLARPGLTRPGLARPGLARPGLARPTDFIDAILRQRSPTAAAEAVEPLALPGNQVGTPTAAGWVAATSVEAVRQLYLSSEKEDDTHRRHASHLWHLAPAGAASRAEYGTAILNIAATFEATAARPVLAYNADVNTGAVRPEYSVLDYSALRAALGLTGEPKHWHDDVVLAVTRRLRPLS